MKTLEQLQAEQAKQIETLKAEHAIGQRFTDAGLPVPDYITGKLYGAQYVSYRKVGRLSDALALFEKFEEVLPFVVMRNGSVIMTPESVLPERERAQGYKRDSGYNAGSYALRIDVRHIPESPAPTSARLGFFARVGGLVCRIEADFGTGYIESCPQLAPLREVRRNHRNVIESASFKPNNTIHGLSDSYIAYASGDMGLIKKSAHHSFLFVADHDDETCKASDCTHAVAQVQNLASIIGE